MSVSGCNKDRVILPPTCLVCVRISSRHDTCDMVAETVSGKAAAHKILEALPKTLGKSPVIFSRTDGATKGALIDIWHKHSRLDHFLQ